MSVFCAPFGCLFGLFGLPFNREDCLLGALFLLKRVNFLKISFSPPDITENEILAVSEALRSGWITTGSRTKELERRIAKFVGAPCAVCLNSQTACAELALRVMGIGPGDEVITSAYTYTATASVIDHVGAKIVLIDTQKDSLEMDYDALERAITPRTKAVIPVDIAGVPCDYARIFEIVDKHRDTFVPESDMQRAIGRIAVMRDRSDAIPLLTVPITPTTAAVLSASHANSPTIASQRSRPSQNKSPPPPTAQTSTSITAVTPRPKRVTAVPEVFLLARMRQRSHRCGRCSRAANR